MRKNNRGMVFGSVTLLGVAVVALGGCRADPTPELQTLSQRPADVNNRINIVEDTNWRMFNQDLGRAFFYDRPSRLTPGPVPY
ncbi:MAG: hypothetical protein KF684_10445 [Phycisphaeraceae bacterium]|nr:hypothetical protein [Phycisphaeraceae bacterium]